MNHNFFKFECDTINPRLRDGMRQMRMPQYYAACLDRIRKAKSGEGAVTIPPTCLAAINGGKHCPALAMMRDELLGRANYYHDRDDVGPGIMRRVELGLEPRTSDEIAKHHAIASRLKLKVRGVKPEQELAMQISAAKRSMAPRQDNLALTYSVMKTRPASDSSRGDLTDRPAASSRAGRAVGAYPIQKTARPVSSAPSVAELINQEIAELKQ